MSIRQFLFGGGKIDYSDRDVSIAVVRDALEKKFKLAVFSESSVHLDCKIIRHWRLYGGPHLMVPNSRMNIVINTEQNGTQLHYNFKWPEYYVIPVFAALAGILPMILLIDRPFTERLLNSLGLFLLALTFCGALVFLDTKYVAYRVRRLLSNV